MKHLFTRLLFTVIILITTLTLSAQRRKVGYYSEFKNAGKFIPYDTGRYTYDNQNNVIKEQGFYYASLTSKWIPFYIYDFVYNANNNLDYYDFTFFDGSQWLKLYRYLYTYDANNNVTQQITKRYSNNLLLEYDREEYTYDTDGLQTTMLKYSVDSVGNFKQFSQRKSFTYNAAKLLDTEYTFLWDDSKNDWDSGYRSTYTYNGNGQVEYLIFELYNTAQSAWSDIHRIDYEYDYEGLMRKWIRFDFTQNEISNYGYSLYEFDGPLAIDKHQLPSASVFPNPAAQNTTLKWDNIDNATLEVHDIQGKVVFAQNNISGNSYMLNTSAFANGLYTYTIKPNNSAVGILSGRIIISK